MPEAIRAAIARRLREARVASKLTQQDVASALRRSRQAVSSWEAGRTLPDLLELRDLAMTYGISTDRLLLGEDVEAACQRALERMRAVSPAEPSRASQSPASEPPPGHQGCPSGQ